MAYHVYHLIYCKVMTIAFCDMQFKDTETQCILWKKINTIVEKKGLGTPIFKGFMVDNVHENWNVVHIVYGIRDLMVKMVDKE